MIFLLAAPAGSAWAAQTNTISVETFGAVADDVGDDTQAISAAIGALPPSGGTLLFPPGQYLLTSALLLAKPRTHVVGYGAKLVQTSPLQRGISVSAEAVRLEGLWLYDSNGGASWKDYPSSATNSIGVHIGPNAHGSVVQNCRVENWGYSGIRVERSSHVTIEGNELVGVGARILTGGANNNMGLEAQGDGRGYPGLKIVRNVISGTAQGLFVYFGWEDVLIEGNEIRDVVGQHGMYLGALVNAVIANNVIRGTGQAGIKLQVAATTPRDGSNISISGNAISDVGQVGIAVLAAQKGIVPVIRGVSITGNVVQRSGTSGILLDHVEGYVVSGNIVREAGEFGIRTMGEIRSGVISDNLLMDTRKSGFHAVNHAPASLGLFVRNLVVNPARGGAAAGSGEMKAGMHFDTGAWVVADNVVTSTGPGKAAPDLSRAAGAVLFQDGANFSADSLGDVVRGRWTSEAESVAGEGVITPRASGARGTFVTASAANASFHVAAPAHGAAGSYMTITVRNESGGSLGALTWDSVYRMSGWVSPANRHSRSITFLFNGGMWIEVGRTPADVPN